MHGGVGSVTGSDLSLLHDSTVLHDSSFLHDSMALDSLGEGSRRK